MKVSQLRPWPLSSPARRKGAGDPPLPSTATTASTSDASSPIPTRLAARAFSLVLFPIECIRVTVFIVASPLSQGTFRILFLNLQHRKSFCLAFLMTYSLTELVSGFTFCDVSSS